MLDLLHVSLPAWLEWITVLSQPVLDVNNPGKRIYWVFIITTLLCLMYVFSRQRLSLWKPSTWVRKAYLKNPSHRTDILLWLVNHSIKVILILPLLASHLGATMFVALSLQQTLGDGPEWQLPLWAIMTLFTLCYFILDDASRFALHLSLHKVPWLWRIHKVHHSAEVLSPLTVYRLHPLEMLLYTLRQLVVIGTVSGLFVWLFKGKITGWSVLGVDAAGFLFNLVAANLRHSHIWLSFGRFENIVISPAQHQIHHSNQIKHRNKNFGSALAIWDKMLGSLVLSRTVPVNPDRISQLTFGLSPATQDVHDIELVKRVK